MGVSRHSIPAAACLSKCQTKQANCTAYTIVSMVSADLSLPPTCCKGLGRHVQVTIGEEGFFGPGDPDDSCNPGYPSSTWPQQSGQDFTNNHKNEAIDFAVRPLIS